MEDFSVSIVYIILSILMVIGLYYGGKSISKGKFGVIAIIIFTLNYGLRFGRGVDYNIYFYIWQDILNGEEINREILFLAFVKFMDVLGLPFQSLIIFQSFILVLSFSFILSHFKKYAKYAMMVIPFLIPILENLIRQYIGFAFVLIGLYYYMNKKWIYFSIFSVIAVLFHNVMVVYVVLLVAFSLIKRTLKPRVSIFLYLLFYLVGNLGMISYLVSFINFEVLPAHFAFYGNYVEEYFIEGGFGGRKVFVSTAISALYLLMMFYGYKVRDAYDHKYIYFYNLFLFGAITYPLFFNVELVARITSSFVFFGCVVWGAIAYHFIDEKKMRLTYACVLFILINLNFIRTLVIPPIKHPYNHQYIWNAEGRDVLSIETFNANLE
ncbi:MAG: EpsG family protein [Bacteroidales bacterium]|nr:EpsG family protein [Candidatus Physcocola equi]